MFGKSAGNIWGITNTLTLVPHICELGELESLFVNSEA